MSAAPKPRATVQMFRPESWDMKYDPSQSFPEVQLGLGVTAQIMWITPDVARRFLSKLGKQQRNLKSYHLRSLISDLRAGRFYLNGQSIIIDADGHMIDGMHRCTSVVETGIPILAVVVRGISSEAYTTIDNSARRSSADALRSLGIKNPTAVAAALSLLDRYMAGLLGKSNAKLSPVSVVDELQRHAAIEESIARMGPLRGFGTPATLGFCHYVFSQIDEEAAAAFFLQLLEGSNLQKGSPILTLRTRIYRSDDRAVDRILLIFKAWNYWRQGKALMCLKIVPGEELPTPI